MFGYHTLFAVGIVLTVPRSYPGSAQAVVVQQPDTGKPARRTPPDSQPKKPRPKPKAEPRRTPPPPPRPVVRTPPPKEPPRGQPELRRRKP